MLLKFLWYIDKSIESRLSLQNMFIIISDQEQYHFLNMCNLCRYAQFLQAQLHTYIAEDGIMKHRFSSGCAITEKDKTLSYYSQKSINTNIIGSSMLTIISMPPTYHK